ncbi:MAG: archease [Candidatus Cloacimonetes bacterium]|nr:archease [Candidatus Cloacimonadota bacterium]
MKKFEIIEHTADFSFRVFGKTVEELFENGASALMELMFNASLKKEIKLQEKEIRINSIDTDTLFIDWLREIHYLAVVEKKITKRIHITKLNDKTINAQIWTTGLNPEDKTIREIKAITYHNIKIIRKNDFMYVDIVCDV